MGKCRMISQPVNLVRKLVLITFGAIAVAACSGQPATPDTAKNDPRVALRPATSISIGERAAGVALRQVGVPYRYGGSSPGGFDCSGLVHYSYARVGKSIPRTTGRLWSGLDPIGRKDMRAGDLLFFSIAGKMSHVGMYLGGDRFVHAPSTGKVVSVETLRSDYYSNAFIRAGRPR